MSDDNRPLIESIFNRRTLICIFTGFASGMPLYVLFQLLPAFLRTEGVGLKEIGLFALVTFPYTWKFLWAPFMDSLQLPFLGRRRGWMLLMQLFLLASIALLGYFNPTTELSVIVTMALLVAFFSASQDIVLDAYRRELLPDEELGWGNSVHVQAYRISGLVPGALGLVLADYLPWSSVFAVVAAFMVLGIGMTLRDEEGHSIDHFDAVIITAPTPQAAHLLEAIPRFEHKAEELMPNPRFVALLGLSKAVDTNAQVLLNSDNGACLRRAILDSAKPGHQSGGFSQIWQLETHEDWAKEHVDVPTDQIANRMIESFERWLGQSIEVAHFRCHRWLYATHPSVNPTPYLWSETDGIGVVGDWLTCEETPKETTAAERAWLSAHALASHLISQWK